MRENTQTNAVLNYMLQGNTITSMEAFEKFGVTRLSAIIYCLRGYGYDIECTKVTTTNRFGGSATYGVYRLLGVPDEESK